MFKSVLIPFEKDNTVDMKNMNPGDIGVIQDTYVKGCVVMRTFSTNQFEVMDLSSPGEDACWTNQNMDTKVKLLKKGGKITLEVI